MVHRIFGLGDGERRRSVRFVADFASVGAFFSTLLGTQLPLRHAIQHFEYQSVAQHRRDLTRAVVRG